MIDWRLIGQPVDIGAHFRAGYERGQQARKERQIDGALAALVENPADVRAQNALAGLDRGFATQLIGQRGQAAAEQERRTRIGRYTMDGDFAGGATRAAQEGDIDLAAELMKLDEPRRKQIQGMYKAAAPVAYQALKLPYEQRKAYIETVRPQLKAQGWADEQIDQFDPTDEGLTGIVHSEMTLEQAMGRDEIKYREVGPGARLVPFDATGRPLTGDAGGRPPVATGAPQGAVASALTAAGMPGHVVAGFLGNFEVEGGYEGDKGDGGSAAGIAQWRGERQTNFQKVIGKPVSEATPAEQAQFVVWEMQNPEAAGMTVAERDAILAAKTPEEAASLIDEHYERSNGKHRDRRVAAAKRAAGGASSEAVVRQQAAAAIAAGADPALVKERAASMGVTL